MAGFSADAPLPPFCSEGAAGGAAAQRLAQAAEAALLARPAFSAVKLRCNLGRQFFAAGGGGTAFPAELGTLTLEGLQASAGLHPCRLPLLTPAS